MAVLLLINSLEDANYKILALLHKNITYGSVFDYEECELYGLDANQESS